MRSVPWDRKQVIASVRSDVWRYVSQASQRDEEALLEAGALLQMSSADVRTLARVQFLMSNAVQRLLEEMPRLARRLRATAIPEEERSPERVRGSIRWGATLAERAATGLPHIYVTAPAKRAFQTPENEVLVGALEAIADQGKRTGWHRSASPEVGAEVRARVASANRWLGLRSLTTVERRPINTRTLARVRSGRAARRYAPAVSVVQLHRRYIKRLDRKEIRRAVEEHALISTRDAVLVELVSLFAIEKALRDSGWAITTPGIVRSGCVLQGRRDGERIDLYYQRTPTELSTDSIYRIVQQRHHFSGIGGAIPDMVLKLSRNENQCWVLVEVKGVKRDVADSARAATHDLLAYRRAFEPVLSRQSSPYGLGIAWGASLSPSAASEVMLCSPDTVGDALRLLLS
jgi:hypothetical protein